MSAQGFLNFSSARASDALVDRECAPQVRGGLAGVAVLEVAVADSLQGACFLQRSDLVEGQGLLVRVAESRDSRCISWPSSAWRPVKAAMSRGSVRLATALALASRAAATSASSARARPRAAATNKSRAGQPAGTSIAPGRWRWGGRYRTGCPARASSKTRSVSRPAQPNRECHQAMSSVCTTAAPATTSRSRPARVVFPLELPIHGQHNRTVTGARALAEVHDGGGSNGQRLGMPRPGFGLIGDKLQRHGDQCCPRRPDRCGRPRLPGAPLLTVAG